MYDFFYSKIKFIYKIDMIIKAAMYITTMLYAIKYIVTQVIIIES